MGKAKYLFRLSYTAVTTLLTGGAGYVGFQIGKEVGEENAIRDLGDRKKWQEMHVNRANRAFEGALRYGPWDRLSAEKARTFLPDHLDAANIPHGDLAVSSKSKKIHSGRYGISQWQRAAAGAVVVVVSRDKDNDLCVALGAQRGHMVPPQGYMEVPLPKADLTGLRDKGASRINGANGELVMADKTIEDCALREVKEEVGLKVEKHSLRLLGVVSGEAANAIVPTVALQYGVFVEGIPQLAVTDTEFAHDDIQKPHWYKVKDIQCKGGKYFVKGSELPIQPTQAELLHKAVQQFAAQEGGNKWRDNIACSKLLVLRNVNQVV